MGIDLMALFKPGADLYIAPLELPWGMHSNPAYCFTNLQAHRQLEDQLAQAKQAQRINQAAYKDELTSLQAQVLRVCVYVCVLCVYFICTTRIL